MSSSKTLDDLLAAVNESITSTIQRRLMATAIGQVRGWLREGESTELSAVLRSLPQLVERAVQDHSVDPQTAATYASRVRSAIRQTGLGPRVKSVHVRPTATPALATGVVHQEGGDPLTLEQELDEAFAALGRWRHLRARLLPVLSKLDEERRRG